MNDIRKAAILLLSLEEPLAGEVLSQLSETMVEAVTTEMARLDDVSQEQREAVVAEFRALARQETPAAKVEILDEPQQSTSSSPFDFLQNVKAADLLTCLVDEQPQTIALVFSHLPTHLGAEVLSGLPSNKQSEVIRRMAALEQISPEVICDIAASLQQRLTLSFDRQWGKAAGVPLVAEILNATDRMTNNALLEHLERQEPALVEQIRRSIFVFEDLLHWDDEAIRSLSKEIGLSQWAVALKGTSEDIKRKILGNLSQRTAASLREEMEFLGPVRVNEVEAMQHRIVDAVRRVQNSGEVVASPRAVALDLIM